MTGKITEIAPGYPHPTHRRVLQNGLALGLVEHVQTLRIEGHFYAPGWPRTVNEPVQRGQPSGETLRHGMKRLWSVMTASTEPVTEQASWLQVKLRSS